MQIHPNNWDKVKADPENLSVNGWQMYQTPHGAVLFDPSKDGEALRFGHLTDEPEPGIEATKKYAEAHPIEPTKYKFGSTQHDISPDSAAAKALTEVRGKVDPADLAGDGTDIDGDHVTLRYGIEGGDTAGMVGCVLRRSASRTWHAAPRTGPVGFVIREKR